VYDTHFLQKFKCVLAILRSSQIARLRRPKKTTSTQGVRAENILSACGIQESHLLGRQGSGNHERDLMKQIKYFGIIAVCAAAFSVLVAQTTTNPGTTKPSNPSVPGDNPPQAPGNNPSLPSDPPRVPGNTNPRLPNGNNPRLPGTPNPSLPGSTAVPGISPIGSPAANAIPSITPISAATPR
jgi:hypothetical protein